MTMLIKMAVRNIFAYRKRSILTLILTSLTTALMVFSTSFMAGSHNTMLRSAVEIYPGYIQVTHRDFPDLPGRESLIFDTSSLISYLDTEEMISTIGLRYESFVLYSHDDNTVAGLFTGIEPSQEVHLSRLKESLLEGEYINDGQMNSIYMGYELANRLKLHIGDNLSFIGTAADYSFTADNLELVGTFKTGLYEFDASGAFVSKAYMDTVMATKNVASHVIILPEDITATSYLTERLNRKLPNEYLARDWSERLSGLVQAMKIDSIFGYITLGIIFLVIFFVIMIYTYLNVFTRIREVGILRAIGTTPLQVIYSFVLESILLTSISVIIGGILGGAVSYYFYLNPIDYSGYEEQFKQYGLAVSTMPAVFEPLLIFRDMIIMFVLSTASTLYPILKITRYRPVEAIKHV